MHGALGTTRLETASTVSPKFTPNGVTYGNNYQMSGKEASIYMGKPEDQATGLCYEGARFYDPTTGRFVTQGSITGTQEHPNLGGKRTWFQPQPRFES